MILLIVIGDVYVHLYVGAVSVCVCVCIDDVIFSQVNFYVVTQTHNQY